jgi:hypothetical protein
MKVKVKVTLKQAQKPRGKANIYLYSSFNLDARWGWVGGQQHAPAALPPAKTRYPLYRRLGGPQEFDHRTV